ncbi:MAG: HNH endonuclease [Solirubrobacteraceae bacterium]
MRIALRPSGGRGEYELTGRQGSVRASDLFDREMAFQITPELVLPGRQAAHRVQGKPRIRLDDRTKDLHAYRLLAGTLILPRPKRELRATSPGSDFLKDNEYAVTGIDVDVVDSTKTSTRLRPTRLWLENASGLLRAVDAADRMALVQEVWDAARTQTSPIAILVQAHETAVAGGGHKRIEKASADLQAASQVDGDAIGAVAAALGAEADIAIPVVELEQLPAGGEEDETDPADAARRAVSKWRKTAERGAAARAFSEGVRTAYRDRCAISGERLPKLPCTLSPGVDGAHILPWARYELNTLKNGICLSKLCHWAFDAGVLRIDHNDRRYYVSTPDCVNASADLYNMDLDYFERFVGPIPSERLPSDPLQRPDPEYLERLNFEMYE